MRAVEPLSSGCGSRPSDGNATRFSGQHLPRPDLVSRAPAIGAVARRLGAKECNKNLFAWARIEIPYEYGTDRLAWRAGTPEAEFLSFGANCRNEKKPGVVRSKAERTQLQKTSPGW